jgi:UPF0755 protein
VGAQDHPDALDSADPHTLLFGEDHGPNQVHRADLGYRAIGMPPGGRSRHRSAVRRGRRAKHRLVLAGALLIVVVVALSGWLLVRPIFSHQLAAKDWTGAGTGEVHVRVNPGDGTSTIADTLAKAGVVRSASAFTDAASKYPDAASIQPGLYRLRQHMPAAQAVALMLDPASRLVVKVTFPEGTTETDLIAKLATTLKVPPAVVEKAAANVSSLGLPEGYAQGNAAPSSAEGFLYPITYEFDQGTSPSDALQQMTAQFVSEDRQLEFASTATRRRTTPYQALIVASMVEGEAKFDADRAKVAQVIYNRLAAGMPLKIDATSRYGAVLLGKNPAAVPYSQLDSPYNTYLHKGLPPTPINNPGAAAMTAAVNPAPGKWLFYVNGDAAGHLSFFDNETDFAKAVAVCHAHGWGCD